MDSRRNSTEAFLSRLNNLMAQTLGGSDNSPGRIYLPNGRFILVRKNQSPYRYFQDAKTKTRFCYTSVADNAGDYWTFDYKPVGRGSRSGRPRHWQMRRLVSARHRKTARDRAYKRLLAFQKNRPPKPLGGT